MLGEPHRSPKHMGMDILKTNCAAPRMNNVSQRLEKRGSGRHNLEEPAGDPIVDSEHETMTYTTAAHSNMSMDTMQYTR